MTVKLVSYEDLLSSKSDTDIDLPRLVMLRTLAKADGLEISLVDLHNSIKTLSAPSLAKTLKSAAIEGLVELEGPTVSLTGLGKRVSNSL